jgi:hypothetical protein
MPENTFVRCRVKLPNCNIMKKTLVFLIFLFTFSLSHAQEYKLHSLFIFSFTRYVQWPEAYNNGDFEIVVLGESPIVDELKTMAQAKKVGDRNIKVTRVNSIGEIPKCHILFISSGKSNQFGEVLNKVSTQPVLLVTEEAGLGAKGSIINFIIKEGKLAFELNQSAVTRQNLRISNELSRLAILI